MASWQGISVLLRPSVSCLHPILLRLLPAGPHPPVGKELLSHYHAHPSSCSPVLTQISSLLSSHQHDQEFPVPGWAMSLGHRLGTEPSFSSFSARAAHAAYCRVGGARSGAERWWLGLGT